MQIQDEYWMKEERLHALFYALVSAATAGGVEAAVAVLAFALNPTTYCA
jgi:hypothetical protein